MDQIYDESTRAGEARWDAISASPLFITTFPPPAHGQSIVSSSLRDALCQVGVGVNTVDISPGELRRNAHYHLRRTWRVFAAIRQLLRNPEPGVLYTVFEAGAGIGYVTLIVAAGRATGRHIVLHHHTAAHVRRRSVLAMLLFRLCGRGAVHVALSECMGRDLAVQYPEVRRVLIAHNAIHVNEVARSSRSRSSAGEPIRLGFISNLSFEKGVDIAVSTVREVLSNGISVQLIIAGPAQNVQMSKFIDATKAELHSHLEYRGAVTGVEKARFFQDIDALLFPTRYKNEAQPLVVLEALAAGRPCLVTDQGYTAELVGEAGLVAPSETYIESAAKLISAWAANREDLQALQRDAAARYQQLRHGSERQFVELLNLIAGDSSSGHSTVTVRRLSDDS